MAVEISNHRAQCPIFASNRAKERESPSSSPEERKPLNVRKSRRTGRKSPDPSGRDFCVLCEVEEHFTRAHDSTNDAIFPNSFVNGFIDHVAPWFKLGVQEDSHEFLRMLIDGMQKSCQKEESKVQEETTELPDKEDKDKEYPFALFRGTVESNVQCTACGASSQTLDPIEDIGLEVTSASTSTSLADVQTALQRYARAENLDAGYKCEKCGQLGTATKQSRLASVPPILTLHLKRFRYGDSGSAGNSLRRSGRSEVYQLTGNTSGPSGSSKIEGPLKFEIAFDLQPYLTPALQEQHKSCLCRLFAVLVHAGKNSHSGHYFSYVLNMAKNEWSKMDDNRITPVSLDEVLSAEAYMLFYRVVQHPVAQHLENQKRKRDAMLQAEREAVKSEDSSMQDNMMVNKNKRPPPAFRNGEEWARAKTRIPPHLYSYLQTIQECIADHIDLTPDFFKGLSEAAIKGKPLGEISPDDMVTDMDFARRNIRKLLRQLNEHVASQGGAFLYDPPEPTETALPRVVESKVELL
jgi:ubiquitin C-terminal hydrolase